MFKSNYNLFKNSSASKYVANMSEIKLGDTELFIKAWKIKSSTIIASCFQQVTLSNGKGM